MTDMDFQSVFMQHLSEVLGVPVMEEIPAKEEERPPEWIRVERTGGIGGLVSDRPLFSCEAWADRPSQANALAQRARLYVLRRLVPVIDGYRITARRETGGPTKQPLSGARQCRLRWLIEIQHSHIQERK